MNNKDKIKKMLFEVLRVSFNLDYFLKNGVSEYGKPVIDSKSFTIKGELNLDTLKNLGNEELKYKLLNEIEMSLINYKLPFLKDLNAMSFSLFNNNIKITLTLDSSQKKFKISVK
jgi:hypothetical protein